jgi:3-hydroxy acid dehydrogenase/malonic semialdehyde reductase
VTVPNVVCVTGATAGIGEAIVRLFISAGAHVIATGRRTERLDALREELGERLHTAAFDVADAAAVEEAFATLPASVANIDLLVNNAGLALGKGPAQDAKLSDWRRMLDTNIAGVLHCTHAVLPGMVERRRGHIVNIGSVAGSWPYPGGNVYGATKAFVRQFSLNLRADLVHHNVRVTDIEPGVVDTEFWSVRFEGDESAAQSALAGYTPLSADDIAETVRWVAMQPAHVNVNTIELMPTQQAMAGFTLSKEPSA